MPLKKRILAYLILAVLCRLIPYIIGSILIVGRGNREEGMQMSVVPGIILVHVFFGRFFLKTDIWVKIITTILVTFFIYCSVVILVVNEFIVTGWDIYGYWDIAIINFLVGMVTWELVYQLINLINKKYFPEQISGK